MIQSILKKSFNLQRSVLIKEPQSTFFSIFKDLLAASCDPHMSSLIIFKVFYFWKTFIYKFENITFCERNNYIN